MAVPAFSSDAIRSGLMPAAWAFPIAHSHWARVAPVFRHAFIATPDRSGLWPPQPVSRRTAEHVRMLTIRAGAQFPRQNVNKPSDAAR